MKHSLIIAPALLCLLSCGHKEKEQPSTIEPLEVENSIRQLPRYELSDSASVGGHTYAYDIVRAACDSLPKAHDEQFGDTRDNTIHLRIRRDGLTIFDRTLTKNTFRSHISDDLYPISILDGICLRGVEAGKGITFMLSVSEPDSDMSVPLAVTIGPDGAMTVVREELDYIDAPDGV